MKPKIYFDKTERSWIVNTGLPADYIFRWPEWRGALLFVENLYKNGVIKIKDGMVL